MVDFRDIDIVLSAIRDSYAWGEPVEVPFTKRRAEILEELCSAHGEEHAEYCGAPGRHVQTYSLEFDTWCVRLVRTVE
jgi:hypothetical protein